MNKEPTLRVLDSGKIYHKPKGRKHPYAWGSNRETIRDASRAKADYEGIDLDLTISLDGVGFVNHWPRPVGQDAWFDPKKRIKNHHRIDKLKASELRRLRVRYQGHNRPMLTAVQAAVTCRDVRPRRLVPCFEAKGMDKRFFDVEWWEHFAASMERIRVVPAIMSLPGGQGGQVGMRKLAAAHDAGLITIWLWRGTPPKGFAQHVDLVKSRPRRGIYRV